jgi:hypothetical protein
MSPQRVSSNTTLGLKIFIPTVWVVFFGAFTLAFLIAGSHTNPLLQQPAFKWIWFTGFLIMLALIWKTLWQLRRVEIDDAFIYVTDFFKTARYPFHNIEQFEIRKLGFFTLGIIRYKVPGLFGKKSIFIAKEEQLLSIISLLPELREKLKSDEI